MPEIDLALVHALQISPRAPWSRIAEVIGLDASTAARRWARLEADRLAWFTARASADALTPITDAALVSARLGPANSLAVAETLARRADVLTVDLTAGTHDLVFVVVGNGIEDVRARIVAIDSSVDCTAELQSSFISRVHREDSQWRLRVLSEKQSRHLLDSNVRTERSLAPDVVDTLLTALAHDARMSFTALADHLSSSEATARRVLTRALASGAIRLGCDVAAGAVGLGRAVMLDVEVDNPQESGAAIAALPQVLRCAEVVAAGNLHVTARFSTLAQLEDFESQARARTKSWRVVQRRTVTREVKRHGVLLDAHGRLLAANSSSSR